MDLRVSDTLPRTPQETDVLELDRDSCEAQARRAELPNTGDYALFSCVFDQVDATAMSASACTAMGGEWSPGLCPLLKRLGVCVDNPPATRTYAYTDEAVMTLMTNCRGTYNDVLGDDEPPLPTVDAATAADDAGAPLDAGDGNDAGDDDAG